MYVKHNDIVLNERAKFQLQSLVNFFSATREVSQLSEQSTRKSQAAAKQLITQLSDCIPTHKQTYRHAYGGKNLRASWLFYICMESESKSTRQRWLTQNAIISATTNYNCCRSIKWQAVRRATCTHTHAITHQHTLMHSLTDSPTHSSLTAKRQRTNTCLNRS